MALKDLPVYVDPTVDSFLRVPLGVDLAARHESRLTALFVREWSRAQSDRQRGVAGELYCVDVIASLRLSFPSTRAMPTSAFSAATSRRVF
jgi:hypothetical protein